MVDNRFFIANLISCSMDTPRVTGDCDVFSIQDRVIDDILGSVREQQAVEAAPRILDPLRQTVITLLRSYLNSPAAKRTEVREAMQRLRSPMTHAAIRDLRRVYEQFNGDQDIVTVIGCALAMDAVGGDSESSGPEARRPLTREDLHLVCFDYIWS